MVFPIGPGPIGATLRAGICRTVPGEGTLALRKGGRKWPHLGIGWRPFPLFHDPLHQRMESGLFGINHIWGKRIELFAWKVNEVVQNFSDKKFLQNLKTHLVLCHADTTLARGPGSLPQFRARSANTPPHVGMGIVGRHNGHSAGKGTVGSADRCGWRWPDARAV